MLEKMIRPCSTAEMMEAKLSSVSTMSAVSRVTSVPLIPMAIPMSALFSAGASLTPSPVMPTTWPARLQRLHDPHLVLRGDPRKDRGVAPARPASARVVQGVDLVSRTEARVPAPRRAGRSVLPMAAAVSL